MHAKRIGGWLIVGGFLIVHDVGWAQDSPAFEVASVIENRSGGMTRLSPGLQPRFPGGAVNPAPGRVSITNATLREIIVLAYGLNLATEAHILKGGPDRILRTRFNIEAKPPDGVPPSQTLLMLRTLLTDRFKLQTHTETRQVPVYVMTRVSEGKLGPSLRPSSADCTSPSMPEHAGERARVGPKGANGEPLCPGVMYEFGKPMRGDVTIRYVSPLTFMVTLIQAFVDRPVVDLSGLSGSFEWNLFFSMSASASPGVEPSGIPIVTALREQFGLKLEPRSHPMEIMVIDSVEMPTPN